MAIFRIGFDFEPPIVISDADELGPPHGRELIFLHV
jgi:hypothetical protein